MRKKFLTSIIWGDNKEEKGADRDSINKEYRQGLKKEFFRQHLLRLIQTKKREKVSGRS